MSGKSVFTFNFIFADGFDFLPEFAERSTIILIKGVMGARSRKLFFLRVSDSTGVVSLKWVPYAGRDIRRKQTRQSVARGICDELSRPGYASERGESCSAEVDPVIRKFGVVKAARSHGYQFVEKGNRFKIRKAYKRWLLDVDVELQEQLTRATKFTIYKSIPAVK